VGGGIGTKKGWKALKKAHQRKDSQKSQKKGEGSSPSFEKSLVKFAT
jgi:hypothetical protein